MCPRNSSKTTTTIGAGNTLLFDGTYYDTYDPNGNLIQQLNTTSTAKNTYAYDDRNRLTSVTYFTWQSGNWVQTQQITYNYDLFNNLIGRTVTGTNASVAHYVFDGTNMILAFDVNDNLTDRYLCGPAVDQVLADEHFSPNPSGSYQLPTTAGTTLWALGDNQNSVRDVVEDNGTLEQHIAYSPFGQQAAGTGLTTTGSVVANFAFGYTGTYTDPVTGLQLHGARWYNPSSQRWLTQDPLGLGPDSNPYRYCGNAPTNGIDPSGMDFIAEADKFVSYHKIPTLDQYHYSLEYWTCCYSVMGSYSHMGDEWGLHGLSPEQMHNQFPGAEKKAAVEEQVDDSGWHAWGRYVDWLGFKVWVDVSVWVGYIHYADNASKIMPIFEGTPAEVKEKWDAIIATAKHYKWAEQAGPNGAFNGTFVNWPRSLYKTQQTNSNTFARYAVRSAGLTFVEMSGLHDGYEEPSQNVEKLEWWGGTWIGGTSLQFLATEPPWKTTKPRPEPPTW